MSSATPQQKTDDRQNNTKRKRNPEAREKNAKRKRTPEPQRNIAKRMFRWIFILRIVFAE